jgi:hypothetical protein
MVGWRDYMVAWHRAFVSQRADRSRQQLDEAIRRIGSDSASATTAGFASCFMPASRDLLAAVVLHGRTVRHMVGP